jgi:hypothetical protein
MTGESTDEIIEAAVRPAGVDATEPSVMPSPAGRARVPVRNKVVLTVSVMLATIMQALDTTIANVALPKVQGTLSATQDEMGWVLTSYIVAAAVTIPLTGWLASEFGRRKVFLNSIVLFTVASACSRAWEGRRSSPCRKPSCLISTRRRTSAAPCPSGALV